MAAQRPRQNRQEEVEMPRFEATRVASSVEITHAQPVASLWSRRATYAALFVLLGALAVIIVLVNRSRANPPGTSNLVTGSSGMISSTHYLAAEAGIEMLKAGGNAIDAAAAVQFALSVVQPQSTGLGGGCFGLFYSSKTKQVTAYDGREEAPEAFNATAFCKDPSNCAAGAWPFYPERVTGGHPVGVPGVVAATARALSEEGTMSLAAVMAPAIRIARQGFPMYEHLHSRIEASKGRLALYPASKKLFLSADGSGPIAPVGALFRNPDLAATLELIASKGPAVMYGGALGQEIVDTVHAAVNPTTGLRGLMSLRDLSMYRAVKRQPMATTYRGATVVGHWINSGAIPEMEILNILEGIEMPELQPGGIEAFSRFIDAQNLGFADRGQYLGDPDFVDVPFAGLLNKTYAAQRRLQLMRLAKAVPTPVAPGVPPMTPSSAHPKRRAAAPPAPNRGTTHFCVVDKDRNVVSWTTTIEENFGSAVVVPGRGILLNNELTDFTALPINPLTSLPYANAPEGGKKPRRTALGADKNSLGGKRPRSSMSPTIVLMNGEPRLALGSPGGSTIIGTVLNALINALDFNMGLQQAIDAPRIVSRNGVATVESGIVANKPLMAGLQQRGYRLSNNWGTRPFGYIEAVEIGACGGGDSLRPSRPQQPAARRASTAPSEACLLGAADTGRMPTARAVGY